MISGIEGLGDGGDGREAGIRFISSEPRTAREPDGEVPGTGAVEWGGGEEAGIVLISGEQMTV